jgi:hypothetical protein
MYATVYSTGSMIPSSGAAAAGGVGASWRRRTWSNSTTTRRHNNRPSSTGSNLGSDVGNLASGFFDIPMLDGMEPTPTQAEDLLTWLNGSA